MCLCVRVCRCVSFPCHPSVPGELWMPLKDGKTAAISVTGSDRRDPQRLSAHMHVCAGHFHSVLRLAHTHTHTHTHTHWRRAGNQYRCSTHSTYVSECMNPWLREKGDKIGTAAGTHPCSSLFGRKLAPQFWYIRAPTQSRLLRDTRKVEVSLLVLLFFPTWEAPLAATYPPVSYNYRQTLSVLLCVQLH